MTLCAFIDDGYTEDGYIVEEPGLYPAVRFRFRPMLATEYGAMLVTLVTNQFPKIRKDMAEAVSQRVKEWDVVDRHNQPVLISTANLLKIKDPLLAKLFRIVSCQEASDQCDEAPDIEADAGN